MRALATVLGIAMSMSSAGLAEQNEALGKHRVDSIFGLKQVNDISIGETDNRILVTLADRVLQLSTFPLRVTADIPLQLEGVTANVNADQTVVVLAKDRTRGQGLGTMRIYRDIEASLDGPLVGIDYPLGTSPFSQALLKGGDELYAVNPSWNTVIHAYISELVAFYEGDANAPPFRLNDLFLKCGRAELISMFEHRRVEFFVTTVSEAKLIELGPLVLNQKSIENTDCFDPVLSSKGGTINGSRYEDQPVYHALIDNPYFDEDDREVAKMVLTFDPDDGQVSVFPMREFRNQITILRSASYGLNLGDVIRDFGEGVGLMAADAKGAVIYVSYKGSRSVHRVVSENDQLRYLGPLRFAKPIQTLDISADGQLVAVVVGEEDDEQDIVLIDNPAAIVEGQALSDQMHSVLNVQKSLEAKGFSLQSDGIYGPQTGRAIEGYLLGAQARTVPKIASHVSGALIGGIVAPKPKASKKVQKSEINKALRGLFPLR